ncbi:MAG: D-inositol-3-phosphate glycosyltransferase [Actinobacteria bacterium]|nr:D-inositol-3-phosphate glycosyltransferase [Actinomycetota bacterium]
MKSGKKSHIATLMVHSSPLDQAGTGDAGGMNVYVVESAKKMAAAGVNVDIFTRTNHSNLPETVEIADGVNVKHLVAGPFEGLSKEELPSQLGALTSSFMNYQKQLPNDYYSLLHSHYWISGQLGWMVSERTGIPLIHTMHTTAKVKNLNLADDEKPEPQTRAIGEEQVVKASTGLIANTDAEAASLVSLYDACPDNVFVVAPGVDLQTFSPGSGKSAARIKLNIAPDAIMLTFVGRIQPHKGPDVLLRAVAEMITHSPHLKAKLAVVIMGGASGSGLNELDKLKVLAKFLKIEDVTHFVAPVKRDELADWYRASDLVCVPSYSESFGLVALEAQACGTPVVATAIGGLRTAVSDGISGSLVDGHDPKAWSAVISRLIAEPQRRLLLSMGAVIHASHFGWENTAHKTLEVYDWALSQPAGVKLRLAEDA